LCTAADHQDLTASACHLIGSPDRHHLQGIHHKLALHSVSTSACSIHRFCSSGTAMHLGAPDSTASCRNSLGQRTNESLEHAYLCLGQHSPCSRAPGTQQHCRKFAVSGIQSTQSNAHHQRHITACVSTSASDPSSSSASSSDSSVKSISPGYNKIVTMFKRSAENKEKTTPLGVQYREA